MSHIQAIIFHKDYFDKRSAEQWLKKHKYKKIKPFHITLNYIRARIKEPNEDLYNYRIVTIKKGIKFVIAYPKYTY